MKIDDEYIKKRLKKIQIDTYNNFSQYDEGVMELYQNYLFFKKHFEKINLSDIKCLLINLIKNISIEETMQKISSNENFLWGIKPTREKSEKILINTKNKKQDIIFLEDTFLRSIIAGAHLNETIDKKYFNSCGYTLDDLTSYYDSTRPSRMELTINSDFEVPQSEIERCRKLIKKIIDNKITKYNNQPIYEPNFGNPNKSKILVIDQSYRDYSIVKGGADDNTFKLMLETAIKENPNSDILIKTHPDAIGKESKKPICYYQGVVETNNIYKITDFINPISMIEYVDKVYVCSSQFGFEALMCGKEVHTFGLPFYANWGLTIDNQKLERRTRTRTLEEIFYIAYIMFSCYFNPKTNQPCEIEDAIDCLLELRKEYFANA